MTDFTYAMDADGVVTLTWDVQSKSMNVMSTEAFMDLSAKVDRALADPAAKGIIITSGKKDFAGGMDLNVIAAMRAGGAQGCAQHVVDGDIGFGHRTLVAFFPRFRRVFPEPQGDGSCGAGGCG